MARGTGTPSPAVINTTSNKNTSQKQQKIPLSDGPEGVTKTLKYYKNCDNACCLCGYDVSKQHHSCNYKKKKKGHINFHTGPGSRSKYQGQGLFEVGLMVLVATVGM